jgi:uncharacterized DUF497 family protein
VALTFEWDEEKARGNIRKHRVSFDEGKTVFNDPCAITISDPDHSEKEDRFIDLGLSSRGRLLVVWYTESGETIRIIGCRRAIRTERRHYEENRRF